MNNDKKDNLQAWCQNPTDLTQFFGPTFKNLAICNWVWKNDAPPSLSAIMNRTL